MKLHHLIPVLMATLTATAGEPQIAAQTNSWSLAATDAIDSVSFVIANRIAVDGRTLDDSFWVAQEDLSMNGDFGNDVWALGMVARLGGTFRDHARVAAQTIIVTGTVSNGLWAAANSINAETNSNLFGEQFLIADQISLLGHIEGDVYAKARSITIGGTIVGDLHLSGDDIIIRPGTTVIGDISYVTTNQSIVLDANSQVSGELNHRTTPAMAPANPASTWLFEVYFLLAAVLVGIPLMLLFPNLTGLSVRSLRVNLWKCGLIGIALLFGAPFILIAIALTVVGLPLAAVAGAVYGLVIYLGKFVTALAIGSALLHKRGQISLAGALLSLVIGLFLYYSLVFIPVVGSSLQATATAFGAGSLVLAVMAGRGRVGNEDAPENSQN